jgi:hypothetical protein
MCKKIKYIICIALGLILNQVKSSAQQYQTTVDMHVPFVSAPTVINGKSTIYYELHIANFANDTLDLKGLDIINPADSLILFSVKQADLKNRIKRIGASPKEDNRLLPPGSLSVIYLEFNLPRNTKVQLLHRLELNAVHGNKKTPISVKGALIENIPDNPLIIGAPLAAGPWAAIYEPSWVTGHRRVFYTVNGTARLPGRFAIDLIKLDDKGRYASENDDLIQNWYGYGTDVLAVSDGVIASVRNDFPESPTLSGYKSPAPENATGNYISIKIEEHQFAFYEHLKPGSIKVKPGQKVKKGQVIASLGFTGQTTGPHLHLHIARENSPLGAEGIPFEFEHFKLLGSYPDLDSFGKKPWIQTPNAIPITKEHPAPNSVIVFSN